MTSKQTAWIIRFLAAVKISNWR